jgi:hypothetical protein
MTTTTQLFFLLYKKHFWNISHLTKVFHSPTDALLLILKNSKIYIKTYIKIAPTCFGLRPSSGSLQLSLAKVTLMLKQSVKLRRYVLCGGVAAHFSDIKMHGATIKIILQLV